MRLITTTTSSALPVYVAKDKGFFADQGLNLSIDFTSNLATVPSLLGRQYDIGVGVQPALIKAAAAGIDVVEVSGERVSTVQDPTTLILSRPDSGIKSPADLKGKKIGAPSISGNINLATLYWLKQSGVDPKSVRTVQVDSPNMPDQLAAGQIDAAESIEPFTSILLAKGYTNVGDPLQSVANPVPMSNWISNGSWARSHIDVITKFKKALQVAIDYLGQHPDDSYAILAKYTGTTLEAAKNTSLSTYTTMTGPSDLEPWVKVLAAVGDFDKKVDVNKLVVTSP